MMVFGASRLSATRFVRASAMTKAVAQVRKPVTFSLRCMSAATGNVAPVVTEAPIAEASTKVASMFADTASKSNGTPLPGVPYDSMNPNFNLTVSTLESDSANYFLQFLDSMHAGGWTWAAAAAGGTLLFRVLAMPLFFMSVRTGSRFQEHQEGLGKIGDMAQAARERNDASLSQKALQDYREYMKKHGLKQRYIFIPVLVQLPMFITIFKGLRSFAEQAHLIPGALDPVLWYHPLGLTEPMYLHLPDPYFIMPTAGIALSLLSLRLNNNIQGMPQLSLTPGGMKLIFGSLAGLFGLIAMRWPAMIQIALATGGLTMVMQQSLLRMKWFRNVWGFWSQWPLSQEEVMARARRRPNMNSPMISAMSGMEPMFKKASALAAGHWEPLPTAAPSYVGVLKGLHHPGAPVPPSTAPTMVSASHTPGSPIAAAAAKGVEASSNAATAALGATPVAQQVLYTQRPKKVKK